MHPASLSGVLLGLQIAHSLSSTTRLLPLLLGAQDDPRQPAHGYHQLHSPESVI